MKLRLHLFLSPGGSMKTAVDREQDAPAAYRKSAKVVIYPAVAAGVDLPDISFCKKSDEDEFVLRSQLEEQSPLKKNSALSDRVQDLADRRFKTLLAPMWHEISASDITINVRGRRAVLLRIVQEGKKVVIEAHWNLLSPYFDQIKHLPLVHPEILDTFAASVFQYAAVAILKPMAAKNELMNLAIESYRAQPELLLASLDIFYKFTIYHIRPTRIWLNRISVANDRYRLQIDVSAAVSASPVSPEFLEEVVSFIHKIVKNYAFRYVDYLWTQQYKITFGSRSAVGMVTCEGKYIAINIHPLIYLNDWKPAIYFSLGYAVILVILRSSGRDDHKVNLYLTMMKTWNRYLSFDEAGEQSSVRTLYDLPELPREELCRSLLTYTIGQECHDFIDDFIMLMNYTSQETFEERLNLLNDPRFDKRAGVYFEQMSSSMRNLNASMMRKNINHSKLIEVLRNDNINHLQLTEFLRTGRLANMSVVDVNEWLLLRTLLYDLINAPKVFRNDYKMLLKVLTKVSKSLIAYLWMLGLDNDGHYEMVSAYVSKLMNDIFVFNRVKIYEIVADPVECLEAEAVTGYLLNWASFSIDEQRSIIETMVAGLPRHLVTCLKVQTPDHVDHMLRVMTIRTSGLAGFYLYQAYSWGSIQDELTEKIRSYFPELLKQAQGAILPATTMMGGAMLLLTLAQIISDERDGFAKNITITEDQKRIVRDLIRQCVDWDQRHFVMMVGGIAAGYLGSIDGWILQQFDRLLGRYDGGDRVVLRSVVQLDVDNMIERTLMTAREGEENAVVNRIQLLRFAVDPVVSDEANKFLRTMAARYGIQSPEDALQKKNIDDFILELCRHIKASTVCAEN